MSQECQHPRTKTVPLSITHGVNTQCLDCDATWYLDICWNCKEAVDSRVPGTTRCEKCGWYICRECGACSTHRCSMDRTLELENYDPNKPGPTSELEAFIQQESGGDPDMEAALRANLDAD